MTRRERLVGLGLGGGVLLLILALYAAGAFEWLELRLYDLRYALTPPTLHSTPILLVRIDEESEARLNVRATEISRALYARAVTRLASSGASLIVFDVLFTRPRDREGDAALATAIAASGNVILARYIGEQGHKVPMQAFREGALGEGLINVSLDSDGVLRRVPVVALDYADEEAGPEAVLAMGPEVARHVLAIGVDEELDLGRPGELQLGTLRIPYPDGHMRIHFFGPPGTFPRMPFWKVVAGQFEPSEIEGRIVLIGASAPSLHDYYQTPYTSGVVTLFEAGEPPEVRGVRMDGFELHANVIQTILEGRFIARSKDQPGLVPLLLVVWGLVGGAVLLAGQRNLLVVGAIWIVGLLLLVLGSSWLFWRAQYWLDVVPAAALTTGQWVSGVAYHRLLETRQRRQVQDMFGRYVSPRVVEHLVARPQLANPSGRKERLTIFFSDVRGFTALSEQMEPQDVQRLLSEYFGDMTGILFRYGGTLDKFMGDAIMAFFGNPEPLPDHARRAVFMALEMQEAVARLNRRWAAEGRRTIGVGMGINTGDVTVGNLGSAQYMDYTVIGDAVNLACRLEQNANAGDILITQATYEEVRSDVTVEALPPLRVKGKREPIAVYRVMGRAEAATRSDPQS